MGQSSITLRNEDRPIRKLIILISTSTLHRYYYALLIVRRLFKSFSIMPLIQSFL